MNGDVREGADVGFRYLDKLVTSISLKLDVLEPLDKVHKPAPHGHAFFSLFSRPDRNLSQASERAARSRIKRRALSNVPVARKSYSNARRVVLVTAAARARWQKK